MDTAPTFRPRPPGSWETFTRVILIALAITVGLNALVAVAYFALLAYLSGDGSDPSDTTVALIQHGGTVEMFLPLLSFVAVTVIAVWRHNTREMLQRYGRSDVLLVHWAVIGWAVLFALGLVLRTVLLGDGSPFAEMRAYAIGQSARLLSIVLLTVGIHRLRSRVREAVATSGYAPSPADMGIRHIPTVAAPLPPAQADTTLDTASLPMADDDFWRRARELATSTGAALPLLESTSTLVRRWLVIEPGDDLARLRATLLPGAVVTVHPEPLRPGSEAPTAPPVGHDAWFGLIEDNGTLRYQSLRSSRLPVWLAQARRADRFSLVPAEAPNVLTATVPVHTPSSTAR